MMWSRLVALSWALVGIGCSAEGPYGGNPPPPPPPPLPPPAPSVAVDIFDNYFAPGNASLTRGGTVTWTWRGGDQHSVTFEDGQFSTPLQSTGSTHSRTFPSAGTFRYRCLNHSDTYGSQMTGSVVVQ